MGGHHLQQKRDSNHKSGPSVLLTVYATLVHHSVPFSPAPHPNPVPDHNLLFSRWVEKGLQFLLFGFLLK